MYPFSKEISENGLQWCKFYNFRFEIKSKIIRFVYFFRDLNIYFQQA
jgi:hypothetical protein